jgi:hypothetical protein
MSKISKENREYWSRKLRSKFSEKKEAIESIHQNVINERAEKNYPIFKKRLGVQKELVEILKLEKDFNHFSNNYRNVLEQKRDKLRKCTQKLNNKLEGWQSSRRTWNDENVPEWNDKDKQYFLSSEYDKFLEGLCRQETKKAFYNSKDGQELKKLDNLQEKAEDLLHSDMIGAEVLKQISLIAKQTNINMTIPQNTVKELMNSK